MRAAAEHVWGTPDAAPARRVGVAGLGKVGKYLTGHLLDDGAEVVATDVNPKALDVGPRRPTRRSTLVADTAALIAADIDVYAPCALGGALNDDTVPALRAKVVAGAANNQLAHPGIEKLLADRGILYAPDYVVNAGGVIQVADEIEGFNFDRAKLRATRIYDTTRRDPPARRRRGRPAGGGRGPARRAADGRGRPAAHDPPALMSPGERAVGSARRAWSRGSGLRWRSGGFAPV